MKSYLPYRPYLPYLAGAGLNPILFSWAAYSLALPTGVTHTRAGTAYVQDHEGIYRLALTNERRFGGARRVLNVLPDTINLTTGWASYKAGSGLDGTCTPGAVDPLGGNTAVRITASLNGGTATGDQSGWKLETSVPAGYLVSAAWIKSNTGNNQELMLRISGIGYRVTATTEWRRVSTNETVLLTTNSANMFGFFIRGSYSTSSALDILVWQPQCQIEATHQPPAEFVSCGVLSAPYHGFGADGVKYFDYENGNTVDVNGVVTEAEGTAIDPDTIYLLDEPAATNLITRSYDLTQTPWAMSYGSIALTQPGINGAANTASRVTTDGLNNAEAGADCSNMVGASSQYGVFRCFVRHVSERFFYMRIIPNQTIVGDTVWFDLVNGTITSTGAAITAAIRSLGGGVFECLAYKVIGGTVAPADRLDTGASYASGSLVQGNTSMAYDILHAEWQRDKTIAEVLGTSPIVTTGTAVIRAADVLNFSGADGFDADNETRLEYLDTADVDADDWDGAVDADPNTYGKLQAVTLYRPGKRPT